MWIWQTATAKSSGTDPDRDSLPTKDRPRADQVCSGESECQIDALNERLSSLLATISALDGPTNEN